VKFLFQQRLSRADLLGGCGALCLAAAFGLILPVPAWSSALCPGKYHDAAVNAWPGNVALSVPLETAGSAGETRASVFRSGLEQSGVRIDSNSPIRLQLIVSVASSGNEEVVNAGLDWHRVDTALSTSLKDTALPGSLLSITAIASDDGKHQIIWAATLHCTIQTDDSGALAHDIGVDLGQLLSESIRPSH
jgi:hypothetical protein